MTEAEIIALRKMRYPTADDGLPEYGEQYDMKAAIKANIGADKDMHFPDTYKLPKHITYSDGSRYKDPDIAPGTWTPMASNGKPILNPDRLFNPQSEWTYRPTTDQLRVQGGKGRYDKYFGDEIDSLGSNVIYPKLNENAQTTGVQGKLNELINPEYFKEMIVRKK